MMQAERSSTALVQTIQASEITLHTGEEAWELLSKAEFLAGWDALYDTCPWATVFQSRAFVTTWYRVYSTKYTPIIIKATSAGKLTGLLTLTKLTAKTKGRVTGAGYYDAEYHVWLTAPHYAEAFGKAAIKMAMQQFPQFDIYLRYIPAKVPLQWTEEPYWKQRCIPDKYRRPLMYMKDAEAQKVFQNTELKKKRSRLQKLGKIEFERITSKEQLAPIFEELTATHDFIQSARFNLTHFLNNTIKKEFFLSLFDLGLLHAATLRLNGKIIAGSAIVGTDDYVHLHGINTYIPFQSSYLSTGFVHFMTQCQWFVKEGVEVLDLTPGGEFYKERLATRHDEVYEMVITNHPIRRWKRRLRHLYIKRLEKAGIRSKGIILAYNKRWYFIKNSVRQLKNLSLLKVKWQEIKSLIIPPVKKVYTISPESLLIAAALPIQKNSVGDMLCYDSKGSVKTRWAFMEEALHRYEAGEQSYTYCKDGRLLYCVWLAEKEEVNEDQHNAPTRKSILLHSFYCHPLGQSESSVFLLSVAGTVSREEKNREVYAATSGNDKTFCELLETIGFQRANEGADVGQEIQ